MRENYFLQMIRTLRTNEEVMLYGNVLAVSEEEASQTADFLRAAFHEEVLDYPHLPPAFDQPAALWGARTVYIAAQLILYRENKGTDVAALFPAYVAEPTPAAILSADLSLRFLPHMLTELRLIDAEDPLIGVLETILAEWHYSGIACATGDRQLNTDPYTADKCLLQLYCDRIIRCKNAALAAHPAFRDTVRASLGIHTATFWNNFELATDLHEQQQ